MNVNVLGSIQAWNFNKLTMVNVWRPAKRKRVRDFRHFLLTFRLFWVFIFTVFLAVAQRSASCPAYLIQLRNAEKEVIARVENMSVMPCISLAIAWRPASVVLLACACFVNNTSVVPFFTRLLGFTRLSIRTRFDDLLKWNLVAC